MCRRGFLSVLQAKSVLVHLGVCPALDTVNDRQSGTHNLTYDRDHPRHASGALSQDSASFANDGCCSLLGSCC